MSLETIRDENCTLAHALRRTIRVKLSTWDSFETLARDEHSQMRFRDRKATS